MSLELLKTIEKAEAQAEAVRQDAQKAARRGKHRSAGLNSLLPQSRRNARRLAGRRARKSKARRR